MVLYAIPSICQGLSFYVAQRLSSAAGESGAHFCFAKIATLLTVSCSVLLSVANILTIMLMKIPVQHAVPKRKLSVFRFLVSF